MSAPLQFPQQQQAVTAAAGIGDAPIVSSVEFARTGVPLADAIAGISALLNIEGINKLNWRAKQHLFEMMAALAREAANLEEVEATQKRTTVNRFSGLGAGSGDAAKPSARDYGVAISNGTADPKVQQMISEIRNTMIREQNADRPDHQR